MLTEATVNALQNPPALHIACTRLTVNAVDTFLTSLREAVDEVSKQKTKGDGTMVTLYGLGSSSAVGPGLVRQLATRYLDVVSTRTLFVLLRLSLLACRPEDLDHQRRSLGAAARSLATKTASISRDQPILMR